MPTLQNINGRSLVPDLSGGLGVLFQAFGTPETRAANARSAEFENLKLEGITDALGAIGGQAQGDIGPIGTADGTAPVGAIGAAVGSKQQNRAIERLAIVAPQAAKALESIRASGDARAQEAFRLEAEKGARQAELVSRQTGFAGKKRAIGRLAAEAARKGENLDRFVDLENMTEPELDLELQRMKLAAKDIKSILGPKFETVRDPAGNITGQRNVNTGQVVADPRARVVEPTTAIGQAREDLENGFITESEFEIIKNTPAKAQSEVGKLIADRKAAAGLYPPDSPQIRAFDDAIAAESTGEGPKLSDIRGVRQEFTKLSGDFIKMRDSIGKVRTAAANPSGAGDLAMIFNFMKILDPGSVVRESEFATAQNAAGVPERIRAQYNRALEGERLSPKTRDDFSSTAERLFGSQRDKQEALETSFRGIAESSGMNPDDVVIDFKGEEQTAPTATNPQTGEKLIFKDGEWRPL